MDAQDGKFLDYDGSFRRRRDIGRVIVFVKRRDIC